MGIGPVPATKRVLEQAGLTLDDIGLFELNEPFAVQVLTWCDGVGVAPDDERLNPYGGAIACGHPLAATGVRLMAQLAHGFRERPARATGSRRSASAWAWAPRSLWENVRWLSSRPRSSSAPRHARRADRARHDRQRRGLARSRTRSAEPRSSRSSGVLDELEHGRLGRRCVLTGKPFVFAAGADIDEFPAMTRRSRRARRRAPATSSSAGSARCRSRRVAAINGAASAAASRSRCTATAARSRPRCGTSPAPRCSSASSPAGAARSSSRGWSAPRARSTFIVENPLRQNRMLDAPQGIRGRVRGRAARPGRVPRRVARVPARHGRGAARASAAGGRSRRTSARSCRKARARSTTGARRDARALPGARPDRGRRRLVARGGLSRRGGRARGAPAQGRGAGVASTRSTSWSAARSEASGMPDAEPRRVQRVGIVGAGLMATAARAPLPADGSRCRSCSATSRRSRSTRRSRGSSDELAELVRRGRLGEGKARFLGSLVSGGTGWRRVRGLRPRARSRVRGDGVKKEVFAELERVVVRRVRPRDEHVLALGDADGRRARTS